MAKIAQQFVGAKIDNEREDLDFYATPVYMVDDILRRVSFEGECWEPACGTGVISHQLKARGYQTFSTDIVDRGYEYFDGILDFMTTTRATDNIITNPPFSINTDFTMQCLRRATKKVVILNKLTFLEGIERKERLFSQKNLQFVYVYSKRAAFTTRLTKKGKKSGGILAFAWFVFDHEYCGDPSLYWI